MVELPVDSEAEETQAVSVHQAPVHSVNEGRVAMPVRQVSSWVPKRLRLTGHQHGTMPTDGVCEDLEFDLTQGDSSGCDAPPLPPPVLLPPSFYARKQIRTWTSRRPYWTGQVHHRQVCCRIFSMSQQWAWKLVGQFPSRTVPAH